MRHRLRIGVLAGLLSLLLPGPAAAAVQTLTFRSAPIHVGAFAVVQTTQRADSPQVDGFVVGMSAELVDEAGEVVPDGDVMLHHVVFGKVLYADATCTSVRGYDGARTSFPVQRFYAEGEEHMRLDLPAGYGYPNRGADLWGLLAMLMNHQARGETVYVRYTVRYATEEALTPVKPVWLDVRNCSADPIFTVPGTGGRGSTYSQHVDVPLPEGGRIVAGGGHLHGGGLRLELADRTCGTTLFTSLPTWGGVEPRPRMHEGGPTHMSSFRSATGIPVAAGDVLRLTAVYDDSAPHVRVMGIMLVFVAPDLGLAGPRPVRCGPLPGLEVDLGSPSPPPRPEPIELLRAPRGPVSHVRSTWVGDYRYGAERVSIRRGTTFTWRFVGRVAHDVTLASGPVGFASPSRLRGTFRHRFARPGVYRLFCSLHPARMTQVVTVR